MGPVTLINCFDVPVGREEEFFALWCEVNDYMRQKPGYIEHKLHRSLAPDARYRFVNMARWTSVEHFRNAHDDGFRALISKPEWKPFSSTPAIYQVVHEASGPMSTAASL